MLHGHTLLMQRNPYLYLHIYCRAVNIFISHDLLPSDLVAPSVEQRWSNPKVVGSNPTLVRVFLCPCVGPFPYVGLTLTSYMGWNISTLHLILSLYSSLLFEGISDLHMHLLNTKRLWRPIQELMWTWINEWINSLRLHWSVKKTPTLLFLVSM